MKGACHLQEVRRLVGRVAIDGAGLDAGLIRHNGDGLSTEAAEDRQQRTAKIGLYFEESSSIAEQTENPVHIVRPPRVR